MLCHWHVTMAGKVLSAGHCHQQEDAANLSLQHPDAAAAQSTDHTLRLPISRLIIRRAISLFVFSFSFFRSFFFGCVVSLSRQNTHFPVIGGLQLTFDK